MNFWEELAAEWYMYQGYFTRTNVKFSRRRNGGYEGEIDVLALDVAQNHLIHIECSTDASPWDQRISRMKRKFDSAMPHYTALIGVNPMWSSVVGSGALLFRNLSNSCKSAFVDSVIWRMPFRHYSYCAQFSAPLGMH